MSFLVIFGSWRRWCTNWFIQKGVMAAYFLSFTLVTYTIGLMQSAAVKVEVYPIWAACFLTVFGCTNSISAYSLDDNYHLWPQVFQCILYTIYVLLILFSVADGVSFIAVFPMVMVALVKVYIRTGSSMRATTMWFGSKIASDFMELANNKFKARQSEDHDPNSMKGYPYVVSFKVKNLDSLRTPVLAKNTNKAPFYLAEIPPEHCDVITIDKAWEECSQADGPLRTSLHACKDITLSFSLFQLLLFRFFGYTCCGESAKSNGRDLVLKNLLGHRSHHERAFELIETELAFLYDFFFTKYSSLNSRGTMIWGLASVASLLWVLALTVTRAAGIFLTGGRSSDASSVTKATLADNLITVIILAALALLEVLQMVFYWTSNWGRVAFVCQYIRQAASSRRTPSCSMRLKAFLSSVKLFSTRKYYWKQQIGQYSLLHSIGPDALLGSYARIINKCCWILGAVGLPRAFYGPPEVKIILRHVMVHPQVRESIVRSLERTGCHITNGVSSLDYNHVSHLRWACSQCIRTSAEDKGSQTRTILTWHIATCYCEMAIAKKTSNEDEAMFQLKHLTRVARKLPRYCAYLIIYAPELLPGHKYDTFCLFRAAANEAASFLKDKEDKYEAMRNIAEPDQESIFGSGIKLGKQLEETGIGPCWKVLGQFWSEMILYLAPSDNITEHIEQLAQGGEFITHLWALLYHAGIAKREDLHQQGQREDHHHPNSVLQDFV
ncbi:hypothetical protein EJB05_51837, partial [Eragrostis curvula]